MSSTHQYGLASRGCILSKLGMLVIVMLIKLCELLLLLIESV
jgi:hypothetical protein